MTIEISNVLTVNSPSDELREWCKENLVLVNPEYAKKARMGFWLGNTPKLLHLYEQDGDKLILPFGVLKILINKFSYGTVFTPLFVDSTPIDFHASIPLYDYQEDAVNAMVRAQYGILQSAAGSGKTQMGIALAARLGRRTLWLCHTLDLVKQGHDRAKQYIDSKLIGTISGGKVNIGKAITFATVQTMSKLDLTKYRNTWDCIIVDEVHRVSGSPTTVTQYQKVLNNLSARHKYGLSATVHRSDGMIKTTFALVGDVAYNVPDDVVADKIMKVGICPVSTGTRISRMALNPDGTLNYTKLITYLTSDEERNRFIVKKMEFGKSSLILSDRLEHLEALMKLLPLGEQSKAVMISGKMTSKKGKEEREKALDDMRKGNKMYLFATYSLAKEGLDIPRLERLYLTTPQKDYAVVTQSIGRIARVFDGKSNPIAYDFVDDIGYLVRSYRKRYRIYCQNHCYFV